MTPAFMDSLVLHQHQHVRDHDSASAGSQPLAIPPAVGGHPNPDPNPNRSRNSRSPAARLQGWFEQMSRNGCVCKEVIVVAKSGGSRAGVN